MMEQMKLDVYWYGPINTKNFDFSGKDCKLRREEEKKELEKFKKNLEEEKLKKEKEEEEKKRLEKEIEQLKENFKERAKKEKNLKTIIEKQKEEIEKNESIWKESQEIIQKRKKIEEEAKKKGIEISRLDDNIDYYLNKAKVLGAGGSFASASTLGTAILFNVTAGSFFETALALGFVGGLGAMGLAGIPLLIAGGYKMKKMFSK